MKISFAHLGHEECESCEEYKLHNKDHLDPQEQPECCTCYSWYSHILRAQNSRVHYDSDSEKTWDRENVCVSVDMQKVIMLPRLEMFKKAIFTQRIIAFNESFVPIGNSSKSLNPVAVLWHEAIAGRKKEELVNCFHQFFLYHRQAKTFKLWLDNCCSQNKNWILFSYLMYIIKSCEIDAESIELNYFEPGHTFMSVDSFHLR